MLLQICWAPRFKVDGGRALTCTLGKDATVVLNKKMASDGLTWANSQLDGEIREQRSRCYFNSTVP